MKHTPVERCFTPDCHRTDSASGSEEAIPVNIIIQLGSAAGINDVVVGSSLLQQLDAGWLSDVYSPVSTQLFGYVKAPLV